jgi:uncharacterized membrane protein
MKIHWKRAFFTALLAMLPMIWGAVLLPQLPDQVAIHWATNGQPDSFVGKAFAVLGIPALMGAVQFLLSIIVDKRSVGGQPKAALISLWMLPVLSIIANAITLFSALGRSVNVGFITGCVVGVVFIILGNYMPKVPQEQCGRLIARALPPERYRKAMRRTGLLMIACGVVVLGSQFFADGVSSAIMGAAVLGTIGLSAVGFWVK